MKFRRPSVVKGEGRAFWDWLRAAGSPALTKPKG